MKTSGLLVLVLSCSCGPRPLAPRPPRAPAARRPDWAGRRSGVFPGVGGAALIEGIAAANSEQKADAAACGEAGRVLRARLVALLPASSPASFIPTLSLQRQTIFGHWRDPQRGVLSLCVVNKDGVKDTVEQSLNGLLRDYMLTQLDLILTPPGD